MKILYDAHNSSWCYCGSVTCTMWLTVLCIFTGLILWYTLSLNDVCHAHKHSFFKNFKNKCENQNNQVRERNGISCGCICAASPEGDLLSWVNHWINIDIGFHRMIFFINKTNNTKCIYICICSRVNELLNITKNTLLRVHRIHVRE